MRFTRIYEEVGLCSGCYASLKERQAVLRNDHRIVHSGDDLQFSFKVLCLIKQTAFLVTVGVGLRSVHVAFTVHHLIILPVDDRTASHANLENVRIGGHKRCGHESAEAPSVHTEAVGIDVRKGLEIADTANLVFHFLDTEMSECRLLEVTAAV